MIKKERKNRTVPHDGTHTEAVENCKKTEPKNTSLKGGYTKMSSKNAGGQL